MPDKANCKRPIQVKFFGDEGEFERVKQWMAYFGADNISAYFFSSQDAVNKKFKIENKIKIWYSIYALQVVVRVGDCCQQFNQ